MECGRIDEYDPATKTASSDYRHHRYSLLESEAVCLTSINGCAYLPLQLNEPIPVDPDKTLAQRIPSPFTDFSVELDRRTRKVLKVFSGGLAEDHLHIIVKLPGKCE